MDAAAAPTARVVPQKPKKPNITVAKEKTMSLGPMYLAQWSKIHYNTNMGRENGIPPKRADTPNFAARRPSSAQVENSVGAAVKAVHLILQTFSPSETHLPSPGGSAHRPLSPLQPVRQVT
jgi:hypothetical protein